MSESEATPVVAKQPSSAAPPAPEAEAPAAEATEVEQEPTTLEYAVRVLIPFIKDHRTAGDSDLAAALADVEAALPALTEPEQD